MVKRKTMWSSELQRGLKEKSSAHHDNEEIKRPLPALVGGHKHVHQYGDDTVKQGQHSPGHKVLGRPGDTIVPESHRARRFVAVDVDELLLEIFEGIAGGEGVVVGYVWETGKVDGSGHREAGNQREGNDGQKLGKITNKPR